MAGNRKRYFKWELAHEQRFVAATQPDAALSPSFRLQWWEDVVLSHVYNKRVIWLRNTHIRDREETTSYDFQLKEDSDKNIKEKLWSEVCEAVVSDWNTLSPEDKNEKGEKRIYLKGKHYLLSGRSILLS